MALKNKILRIINQIRIVPVSITIRKLMSKLGLSHKNDYVRDFGSKIRPISKSFFIPPSRDNLLPYKDLIVNKADKLCKHIFDLLGSKNVKVAYDSKYGGFEGFLYDHRNNVENNKVRFEFLRSNNQKYNQLLNNISSEYELIDWQVDFKSGYRWDERQESNKIVYGDKPGADIKIPWELGRMQHLTYFVYAYILTEDEKYFLEYKNQIFDFIAFNPIGYGTQWMTSMDVSLRIVSWLVTYDLFNDVGVEFDDEFTKIFTDSVNDSISYIYENIEWSHGMRGNHYFTNIVALLFAGLYTNNNLLYKFAYNNFKKELEYQFGKDGGNFEASTGYHVFVHEMVEYTYLLTLANGEKNKRILERLIKLREFSNSLKYYDNIPLIGDFDSGHFLELILTHLTENNVNFDLFNILNNNSTILKNNKININSYLDSSANKPNSSYIKSFDDFGLYIKSEDKYRCYIRCGDLGQRGKGGHSHNDQLSFVLFAHGREIIVDPGTYVYTSLPEKRNRFRSTEMHNTLKYKEDEQYYWFEDSKDDLFWIRKRDINQKVIKFNNDTFIGSHQAFDAKYNRKIEFTPIALNFTDALAKHSTKKVFIHLASEINPVLNNNAILLKYKDINIAEIICDSHIELDDSFHSPKYGLKVPTKVIIFETDNEVIKWSININDNY